MENKQDITFADQKIVPVQIEKNLHKSFIEYAMSVIVARALPDVRDGLKPVHRRILFAMYDDKLTYDRPFRKSATTVGNVLGRYHPHGDSAVYDAMVRLAQDFSMRYPLIDGHGNFGNVDGDGAAAYRYTEARMAEIMSASVQILKDSQQGNISFMKCLEQPVLLEEAGIFKVPYIGKMRMKKQINLSCRYHIFSTSLLTLLIISSTISLGMRYPSLFVIGARNLLKIPSSAGILTGLLSQ